MEYICLVEDSLILSMTQMHTITITSQIRKQNKYISIKIRTCSDLDEQDDACCTRSTTGNSFKQYPQSSKSLGSFSLESLLWEDTPSVIETNRYKNILYTTTQILIWVRDTVSGIRYHNLTWGTVSQRLFEWHPTKKKKEKKRKR